MIIFPYIKSTVHKIVSRETKRTLISTLFALVSCLFCYSVSANDQKAESKSFVLAISQIVEHPALDAVREGLLSYLSQNGFVDSKNLHVIYKNAQGNITTSSQIAYSLMAYDPKPDVFIAIGTPTAQNAIAAGRKNKTPVVFSAVTDPVSSRLVGKLDEKTPLVTGVIDFPPIDEQIILLKTFFPDLKKVGVIYNSGESNSVSVIKTFTEKAKKQNIEVFEKIVTKAVDLTLAFRDLYANGVQVIYVPQDNTIISAAPRLAQLSYTLKIPVFTSDNGSVEQGALASLSYGYHTVGEKTGEYALRIFKGEEASSLPITTPEKYSLYINVQAAEKLNIEIPEDLLKKAVIYPK